VSTRVSIDKGRMPNPTTLHFVWTKKIPTQLQMGIIATVDWSCNYQLPNFMCHLIPIMTDLTGMDMKVLLTQ
jgi:hypothetical protein